MARRSSSGRRTFKRPTVKAKPRKVVRRKAPTRKPTKRTFKRPTVKVAPRRVTRVTTKARRPTPTRRAPTPTRKAPTRAPSRRPTRSAASVRASRARTQARLASEAKARAQAAAARQRKQAAEVSARRAGFRSSAQQAQVKSRNLARQAAARVASTKRAQAASTRKRLLAQREVQLKQIAAEKARKAPTRRPAPRRAPTPTPATIVPPRPTPRRVPAPAPIISAIPKPAPRIVPRPAPKPGLQSVTLKGGRQVKVSPSTAKRLAARGGLSSGSAARVRAPTPKISAKPKPPPVVSSAAALRTRRARGRTTSLISTPAVEVPVEPVGAGIPSFIPQAEARVAPTIVSAPPRPRPTTAVRPAPPPLTAAEPTRIFEPVVASQSGVGGIAPSAVGGPVIGSLENIFGTQKRAPSIGGEPAIGPVVPGTGGKVNVVRKSGKVALVSPSTAKRLAARGDLSSEFDITQETQRGGFLPRDSPLREVPLISETRGQLKKKDQLREETLATRRGDAPFLTRGDIATQRVLSGATFGPGESIEGITGTQVEKDVIGRTRREQDVATIANVLQAQRFTGITEAESGIEVLARQRELEAKGQQQIIEPQFTFGAGFAEDRNLARVGGVVTKEQQNEIARRLRETPEPSLQETLGFGVPSETVFTRIQPKERTVKEIGTEQKLVSLGFDPTTQNIDRGITPTTSLASVPTPIQTFDQRTVGPVKQDLGIESTLVPLQAKGIRGRLPRTAFNKQITNPDVASPFSRVSAGFTQSLQNELIGIENIGLLATGQQTKEFFPTPSQQFIAGPIESGISAARGEVDFRADLEKKGQRLGADVVNDPFFAFGDILAQGAVTVATLGIGKGILTGLRVGGITARAVSVGGKAASRSLPGGGTVAQITPKAGVIGARAGPIAKPRVTQQFVDPLTKNIVEIPDPKILSRTLQSTPRVGVEGGFGPISGLRVGRVERGFRKTRGKVVRVKGKDEPALGRTFFADPVISPPKGSGILSATTRFRTLPTISQRGVLPPAGTLARRIPKGVAEPSIFRVSTPADLATQNVLGGLVRGARRGTGAVTKAGKKPPPPPRNVPGGLERFRTITGTVPTKATKATRVSSSVLAPPKGVKQSPLFRITPPARLGDVARAAGRAGRLPEPTGIGGVVRAGIPLAAKRGPRVTRNVLGTTPRTAKRVTKSFTAKADDLAKVTSIGGRAGARQLLVQTTKQVTKKGARTTPKALTGIDDLARISGVGGRAITLGARGTKLATVGARTTQVTKQVAKRGRTGQRAITGFGRVGKAAPIGLIPLGVSVPGLVQPARAQTVGLLQPFTEQRDKKRTGVVSILSTRETQFPGQTRAIRNTFANRLFTSPTGSRTPRLQTGQAPRIRQTQTFDFPGPIPQTFGRGRGPIIRRDDQGSDFAGGSRKQRRFFRVFDVGRDRKGKPIPFGRVSRGLGVQVQSDAPIFEVEDVLGPRKKKPSQESFFDLGI